MFRSSCSDDRLALVSYNHAANVNLQLTRMDDAGQKRAVQALSKLQPDGQTNLWDGLLKGLQVLGQGQDGSSRFSTVLLLTDGLPNIVPPRGHLPMLKKMLSDHPNLKVNISTFGFGYALDSVLLRELAIEGGGLYSFIPDSGMVGTCFVNATSNALSMFARDVALQVRVNGGVIRVPRNKHNDAALAGVSDVAVLSLEGATRAKVSLSTKRDNASLILDTLQLGQSRQIMFRVNLPREHRENASIEAKLVYTKPSEHGEAVSSVDARLDALFDEANAKTSRELQLCRLRAGLIDDVHEALEHAKRGALRDAKRKIANLIQVAREMPLLGEHDPAARAANGLLQDLVGQISEALSSDQFFQKWGQHYLPSLARAHSLQQCSNFKDPGVQSYGGAVFQETRDHADQVFLKLPPPVPSIKPVQHPKAAPVVQQPVNMRAYYNVHGGCFAPEALVTMADRSLRAVSALKRGDLVATRSGGVARVNCVVVTQYDQTNREHWPQIVSLPGGLRITPYHPIVDDGKWIFPKDHRHAVITTAPLPALVNLVLDSEHVLIVNGRACVALAHNIKGDVVEHSYLGSNAILRDLQASHGWEHGLVFVEAFIRSPSGLVCGIKTTPRESVAIAFAPQVEMQV